MNDRARPAPGVSDRRSIWLAGVMVLALLALVACNRQNPDQVTAGTLQSYLPADWKPLTGDASVTGFQLVNIDGDADQEWLYFFHYDSEPEKSNGPVGGIIYDAQPNADMNQPAAFFVPYRLLPDWREGKGQGYLGETTVSWSQAWIEPENQATSANELVVTGLGPGSVATRLSLFRWQGQDLGYGVTHFQGNFNVQALPSDRAAGALIDQVVTLNRLDDRSRLCQRVVYTRQGSGTASFSSSLPGIVFCQGAQGLQVNVPEEPTYPEAVVLTWLLGGQADFLALPDQNEVLKAVLDGAPQRVVTLDYPGTASVPPPGVDAVSTMAVNTLVETGNGLRNIQWTLLEQRPGGDELTSRWRIASAQRIP